jgi:hypothetical protein
MNTSTKLIVSLAALALTTSARAADPDEKLFLQAKPKGVVPVLVSGASRAATYQQLAALTTADRDKPALAEPRTIAKVEGGQGFGFAGASTDNDVALMSYGFIVSALVLDLAEAADFADDVKQLEAGRELLAPLSPAVLAAVDKYIASAKAGRVDPGALASIMSATEVGIAVGPPRGHGYLSAGIWFGLALVAASNGEIPAELVSMARPLAVMFDEDASLGGSDRKVAASLRDVALIASTQPFDGKAFQDALTKAFSVQADTPSP